MSLFSLGRRIGGQGAAAGFVLAPDARIHYGYSLLTGEARRRYEDICAAFAAGEPHVTLRGVDDAQEAFALMRMVRADHPEVHWIGRGTRLSKGPGYIKVHLERGDDARPGDDAALLAAADAFRRALPDSADEYTSAKAAFTQVAAGTRYDQATAGLDSDRVDADMRPYEATGALVDGIAVCSGFSKAVQFLLQRCGIMAALLTGVARSASNREPDAAWGPHAWLAVRIDGRFYHMDPTWTSMGRDLEGMTREVSYDYFGLTDREVAATHQATTCPYPAPVCDATMAEYYRREGLCLRAWDAKRYADMVCRQLAAGRASASVKAANDATYRKMVDGILHSGGWAETLRRASAMTGKEFDLGKVHFTVDATLRTLTVWADEAA